MKTKKIYRSRRRKFCVRLISFLEDLLGSLLEFVLCVVDEIVNDWKKKVIRKAQSERQLNKPD